MLEINDVESSPLNEQAKLEHQIKIPPKLQDFLNRRGPLPPVHNDLRQYPRFYFPVAAVAEFREPLPIRPQDFGQFVVVVRDVSRGGLAFYHTEQVYPGEKLELQLSNGPKILSVVRCNQRAESCYEVAGTFV